MERSTLSHVLALLAITVAGWLTIVQLLESCVVSGWNHCDARRGGDVPLTVLASAVALAVFAVVWMRPWRRMRDESLRSRIITVAPVFVPMALVAGAVSSSPTPHDRGRDLIERVERKLEAGASFPLLDVLRHHDEYLAVFRPDASAGEIEDELLLEWDGVADVVDPAARRPLWIVVHGDEIVAWTRLPARLGGRCVSPGFYGYEDRFAAARNGDVTVAKATTAECRP